MTAPPTPRTVLVTGATGFTGGALARAHAARGDSVRALVRSPGDAPAAALRDAGIEVVPGDLTDSAAVHRGAEGCDLIQHVGALFRTAGHPDSVYHEVNDEAVGHVLDAAARRGVRRVVHCSTVGVHGHVSELPSDETAPFNPGDVYQRSKLAGETRVREAMGNRPFEAVVCRPAGIYGPGDLRFLKVFRGLQKGRFPMFGSGEVTYHFTYIDDLVGGLLLAGDHPEAAGQTLILGGDGFYPLNRFVGLVAAAVGGRPPRLHLPLPPLLLAARLCEGVCRPLGIDPPLHVRRCEFYTKARAFSNAKAKRVIGFDPQVGLADGVYRTAQWYAGEGLIGPPVDRAAYDAAVSAWAEPAAAPAAA
ncbi:NAD-dependent epimerase/dehydratase family protein [Phycisphaera mikurensis]|uniref:NAD-dependent epimerase/dehydratase family protein n=1 Tax=Phycisphaera mikurensis (strain NBRC 102666 / KCTC 22515 / FYK2301M01) TaxID=1142394 RepID=I0IBD4_PHYMF|nr:NAD-dependent epimerase/dehydratase family protein [Phycisphaera mikurensis]MBB6443066.1 nucleoside-diphosphate-sugar epimerase [Phycisphaera mikurensis]BAM02572.1 NAD-dependent epimerase/dehydratase family protein [Phycisphaera mikurensis NBRC 102666]